MSYVGSVYLIQLFVNFISHLSTEAESRAHITHSSSLLLLQHTQYILHMPQHWWNSSQHYTANTTQYKSYFLNAKNLWDASERGNIPTQPQHLGLKHKVMAQVWQEWGVSAGLGTPNTLQQCRRIFYKCGKGQKTQLERPYGSSGYEDVQYLIVLHKGLYQQSTPQDSVTPVPSSLPHTSPSAFIFTSEISPLVPPGRAWPGFIQPRCFNHSPVTASIKTKLLWAFHKKT